MSIPRREGRKRSAPQEGWPETPAHRVAQASRLCLRAVRRQQTWFQARLLACIVIALIAAAPSAHGNDSPSTTVNAIADRIPAVTFKSEVLGTDKIFCAVLPDNYNKAAHPWPVLFLFHGRGRDERSLVDDPGAREILLAAPFVTILPDGDDGWYINSPVKADDRYQDYLDEVVDLATAQYNLSTIREQRGLSGWSMGGYGCTRYAIAHPNEFAALAPMIGLLDFPRTGLPEGQSYEVPTDRFGADEEIWSVLNPIHSTEKLRGMDLCILTGTTAFDRTMNLNFCGRLAALEMPHTLHLLPGAHTFEVVRNSLPIVVKFMSDSLLREQD